MSLKQLVGGVVGLEQRMINTVTQLFDNQQQTQTGLLSADLNLRVHQKLIADLVTELMLVMPQEHKFHVLRVEEMDDPQAAEPEEGEKKPQVLYLNWDSYYESAKADLDKLAQQEKLKAAAEAVAGQKEAPVEGAPDEYPADAEFFGGVPDGPEEDAPGGAEPNDSDREDGAPGECDEDPVSEVQGGDGERGPDESGG